MPGVRVPDAPDRRTQHVLSWVNRVLAVVAGVAFVVSLYRTLASDRIWRAEDGGVGQVVLLLAGILFVYPAANLIIRPFGGSTRRWWISVTVFSALCLVGIASIWQIVSHSHFREEFIGVRMENQADVDGYLATHLPAGSVPFRVPTGVYLETLEFTNGFSVKVTGYVWQKYSADIPASVQRGLVLPEQQDATALTEVYRQKTPESEMIGWKFNATLRQDFDYAEYPLDRQDVWLRMWHVQFDRQVVLVPDLRSFPPWRGHSVFGVDSQLVAAGWSPHYSAYSYGQNVYHSSFGFGFHEPTASFPELYFNLGLDRSFRGPLFETIIPLAFVAILIFAAMFVTTLDAERRLTVGFSTLTTITFAMSAMLVVALRHGEILNHVATRELVYLEMFPFVVYFMIFAVAVNAILYTTTDIAFLHWRENLLPALLFWPVLLGTLLIVTLLTFY